MPDLLGATNPVPGYDIQQPRIHTPQVTDQSIQNIVDPDRVTRPDAKDGQQGSSDATNSFATRFESNYMTFIQRLRGAQHLSETFMSVMQGLGLEVSSGIRSGFAQEMAEFLEFIQMDESQLLSFLQSQAQSGSRFSGPLFQLLRNAYNGSTSELVRNEILQFVRRFGDYSSTEHIEDNILRTTGEMSEALPGKWSAELSNILAQLENGVSAGDRAGNLKLLREQVFPLVSRYVSLTHDHGLARNLLSAMTLDVARYENGNEEALIESLRHLAMNNVLPDDFADLPDSELLRLLKDSAFFKAADNDAFADKLANVTQRALTGEAGVKTQEAFHNIMTSILINESVYMPLRHIMLPVNWNGDLMFSEIWVDPDADGGKGARGHGEGGKATRILVKMDIQSLGAFDVLIQHREEGVSLLVGCPKSVSEFSPQITQSLRTILSRNGLKVEQVQVAQMRRPLTVSEVFPKLFERMSGVNVKV